MKELSIEEKAKAYDEAIEKGKQIQNTPYIAHWDIMKEVAEHLFPELKESDEERIREWLICTLKSLNNSPVQIDGAYEMMLPAIAWLEKQGEQKPAWSEEDEAIYYGVIETEQYMLDVVNGIKKFAVGNISIKEECTRELNWLKSLEERYTWKPSDEQMDALNDVISSRDIKYDVLSELWKDLEKLKGLSYESKRSTREDIYA